jgi:hypothetical protein
MQSNKLLFTLFICSSIFAMQPPIQPKIGRAITPEDLVPKDCLERCGDLCNPLIDHGPYVSRVNLYPPFSLLACCGSIPVTNAVGSCLEWSDRELFSTHFFVAPTTLLTVFLAGVCIEDYAHNQRIKRSEAVEEYRRRLLRQLHDKQKIQ